MNTPGQKEKLNWRRIAFAALLMAAVAFCITAFPQIRQAMAEREIKMAKARYATGLSPCEFHSNNIDSLLLKYLPAPPTASITASPSFSDTVAIRLVGQDLYYFVLDFPLDIPGKQPYPEFNSNGVPSIHKSRVSADIARRLPRVLGNDILHAEAEPPTGLDGTVYYFKTSSQNCAMTWSPRPDTRASKFTELFDQLAKHAQAGNHHGANSEKAILAILESLENK